MKLTRSFLVGLGNKDDETSREGQNGTVSNSLRSGFIFQNWAFAIADSSVVTSSKAIRSLGLGGGARSVFRFFGVRVVTRIVTGVIIVLGLKLHVV